MILEDSIATPRSIMCSSSLTFPGKFIIAKDIHGIGRYFMDVFAEIFCELRKKILGEHRDVLPALSQRRHADREHIEPVIEVFAKSLLHHHAFEVAVRGRNDPDVDRNVLGPADHFDRFFLDEPEKLDLKKRGKFPYFV